MSDELTDPEKAAVANARRDLTRDLFPIDWKASALAALQRGTAKIASEDPDDIARATVREQSIARGALESLATGAAAGVRTAVTSVGAAPIDERYRHVRRVYEPTTAQAIRLNKTGAMRRVQAPKGGGLTRGFSAVVQTIGSFEAPRRGGPRQAIVVLTFRWA